MRLKLYPSTLVFVLLITFGINKTYSQILGQDAEGFSSLVQPASLINLDLANEIASFSYYQNFCSDWLIGGELKGKAENGISNLFQDGDITASASISALLGHYFGEGKKDNPDANATRERINRDRAVLEAQDDNLVQSFDGFLKQAHAVGTLTFAENRKLYVDIHSRADLATLKNQETGLSDKRKSQNKEKDKKTIDLKDEEKKLTSYKSQLQSFSESDVEFKALMDSINKSGEKVEELVREIRGIESKLINLDAMVDALQKLQVIRNDTDELDTEERNIKDEFTHYSFLTFLRLSAEGATYRQDAANGAEDLDERFPSRNFNGFRVEAGLNYNRKGNYLGFSLAGNYTNNLSELSATSFTLIVDDNTTNPGLLRTTRSIEAFGAGKVDEFQRYDVNLDAAFLIDIDQSKELSISVNPFGRYYHYVNSNFEDRLDFGLGIFAINSAKAQLLGGAVVQYNDVTGANDDPTKDITAIDRVSFGLIVRFAFSGIDLSTKK